MKHIQTCLWFDNQGEEAAKQYVSLFRNSKILRTVPYGEAAAEATGTQPGSVMTVDFELAGIPFLALNGGPRFKLNPAISFFVTCESEAEIDELWNKLRRTARMELQAYPFAKKYGWCEDRFGINWQLILEPGATSTQKIRPALLFANQKYGKAHEAIDFYVSRFPGSKLVMIARDEKTHSVLHSKVSLSGWEFVLMEGPLEHEFDFSPAVSFMLGCESQEEIDRMWSALSAVPEAEQCGWLCDRFGVSWQVIHADWGKWLGDASPAARERMMKAILGMKKPDVAALKKAGGIGK